MILETAQILCTNLRLAGIEYGYRITHQNHPSVKWARACRGNHLWLRSLGIELCLEYTYRYRRRHIAQDIIEGALPQSWSGSINIPGDSKYCTTPYLAMPPEYRVHHRNPEDGLDTITSYRTYYLNAKRNLLTYTKRNIPYWISEHGLGVQK